MDPPLRSAIGSSADGIYEKDPIYRCGKNIPVLASATEHLKRLPWCEGKELQRAVTLMFHSLNIQSQRCSSLFGNHLPSVIIDLDRDTAHTLDSYFRYSLLLPDHPRQYNGYITESFVMGYGRLSHDAFFHLLKNSTAGCDGIPKDLFLARLSIRYLDTRSGYTGEAYMQSISYETAAQHRLIRFRTADGNRALQDAFYIADGQKLRLTAGYDGTVRTYTCKHLNARNNNLLEPDAPLTDLTLYTPKYLDRNLLRNDGMPIPYRDHPSMCYAELGAHPLAQSLYHMPISERPVLYSSLPFFTFLSMEQLQGRICQDLYSLLNQRDRQVLDRIIRGSLTLDCRFDLNSRIRDAARKHAPLGTGQCLLDEDDCALHPEQAFDFETFWGA